MNAKDHEAIAAIIAGNRQLSRKYHQSTFYTDKMIHELADYMAATDPDAHDCKLLFPCGLGFDRDAWIKECYGGKS